MSYNFDHDIELNNPELHMSIDASFENIADSNRYSYSNDPFVSMPYELTPDKIIEGPTVATPRNKLNFDCIPCDSDMKETPSVYENSDTMNIQSLFEDKIIKSPKDFSFSLQSEFNIDKIEQTSARRFLDKVLSNENLNTRLCAPQSHFYSRPPLKEYDNQEPGQIQLAQQTAKRKSVVKRLFSEHLPSKFVTPDIVYADSMPECPCERKEMNVRLKRIGSVPSVPTNPQLIKPISFGEYSEQKQESEFNDILIGDLTRPHSLSVLPVKNKEVVSISPYMLSKLLDGECPVSVQNTMIIDCRYPYEYDGGHIKNAINIYTKEKMENILFHNSLNLLYNPKNNNSALILILHCEYSQHRGPSMARFIRNKDRNIHYRYYPRLFYPEIYILNGGYREFFDQFPSYCMPNTYVPMIDARFCDEYAHYKKRAKLSKTLSKSSAINLGKRQN